jgi:hypothetical protein
MKSPAPAGPEFYPPRQLLPFDRPGSRLETGGRLQNTPGGGGGYISGPYFCRQASMPSLSKLHQPCSERLLLESQHCLLVRLQLLALLLLPLGLRWLVCLVGVLLCGRRCSQQRLLVT